MDPLAGIVFPSIEFMAVAYFLGAVAACFVASVMPKNFRVGGIINWMLLFFVVSLPVFAAVPLTSLIALNPYAALPPTGIAVILSVPWVFFVLPALLPDFQPDTMSSTFVMAVLIGGAVFGAGIMTNSWEQGLLFGQEQAVFIDRGAGGWKEGEF